MNIDIFQIRLRNLLPLLEKRGEPARLARAIGIDPNYLSRIKAGKKRIGDITARKLESALGLDYGWMDLNHRDASPRIAGQSIPDCFLESITEEQLLQIIRSKGLDYSLGLLQKAFGADNKKGD